MVMTTGGLAAAVAKLQVVALLLTAVTIEGSVSGTSNGRSLKLTTDTSGCSGSFGPEKATLKVHRMASADVRIVVTKTEVRVGDKRVAKLDASVEDVRFRFAEGILLVFVDGNLVETDT